MIGISSQVVDIGSSQDAHLGLCTERKRTNSSQTSTFMTCANMMNRYVSRKMDHTGTHDFHPCAWNLSKARQNMRMMIYKNITIPDDSTFDSFT